MSLQVVDNHIEKHEGTDTSGDSLIEVVALSQERLEDKVERSELREANLHVESSDDSFEAIISVEANVCKEVCFCISYLQDGNIGHYPLDVFECFYTEKESVALVEQIHKLCRVISDKDVNV